MWAHLSSVVWRVTTAMWAQVDHLLKKAHPHTHTVVFSPLRLRLETCLNLLDCVPCISASAIVTLVAEHAVRLMATDRTRDPTAATADPDSPDLPADDDVDPDEAHEGGDASDNMASLQPVLRMLAETQGNW